MKNTRIKTLLSLLFLASICLIFSGCVKQNASQDSNNPEASRKKVVTASFYPIYIATLNITKDIPNVETKNLTKPFTGCLHDYSLTTDDLRKLENTDILVINGAGMETFMKKVIDSVPDLKIVDSCKADSPENKVKFIKDIHHNENNPHVWLSITEHIKQINNISDGLAFYDPQNSSAYKKNAQIYIKKLQAQKTKMKEALAKTQNRDIITFHEAFPYFAEEFDLNIAGVIQREPGSEPSAKELEETIQTVKMLKIKALFAELQYPAKAAQSIARETGAKLFILDPIVSGELDEDAYLELMDKNLATLHNALK